MFGIWNYFSNAGGIQAKKNSLQTIRTQIDELEKKRSFLQKKVDDQGDLIKDAMKKKNQRDARVFFTRRLQYEKQVTALDASIMNLETMAASLDAQAINETVAKSMAIATKEMKKAKGDYTVEKIDDIASDAKEAMEDVGKISVAVSQPIGETMDTGELDDQLAAFMASEAEQDVSTKPLQSTPEPVEQSRKTSTSSASTSATQPPTHYPLTPKVKPEDEDMERALAELAAQMAT